MSLSSHSSHSESTLLLLERVTGGEVDEHGSEDDPSEAVDGPPAFFFLSRCAFTYKRTFSRRIAAFSSAVPGWGGLPRCGILLINVATDVPKTPELSFDPAKWDLI